MKENQSPYAVFQIGLGIVCLLIGTSGLIMSERHMLTLQTLFLGVGILLYGLTNNKRDESEKGKRLSSIGSVFYVLGGLLIFYNTFFNTK